MFFNNFFKNFMFSIVNKEEKGTLSFLTAGIKPASKEGRFSHRLIPFDTYSFKSSGGNCVPQTPMISGWRFERTREICVCPIFQTRREYEIYTNKIYYINIQAR